MAHILHGQGHKYQVQGHEFRGQGHRFRGQGGFVCARKTYELAHNLAQAKNDFTHELYDLAHEK